MAFLKSDFILLLKSFHCFACIIPHIWFFTYLGVISFVIPLRPGRFLSISDEFARQDYIPFLYGSCVVNFHQYHFSFLIFIQHQVLHSQAYSDAVGSQGFCCQIALKSWFIKVFLSSKHSNKVWNVCLICTISLGSLAKHLSLAEF